MKAIFTLLIILLSFKNCVNKEDMRITESGLDTLRPKMQMINSGGIIILPEKREE
jgi:hypothetical protein